MFNKKSLSSNQAKVLLGMSIIFGVIVIFKGGYSFGQWLYHALH